MASRIVEPSFAVANWYYGWPKSVRRYWKPRPGRDAGAIADSKHAEDEQRRDFCTTLIAQVDGCGSTTPFCAIHATKKEKATATNAMKTGPGLALLMKWDIESTT